MSFFFVVPDDTLWLRSGLPFLAGEDSFDPGLFPPTPWTFQGMIRTRLLLDRFEGSLDGVAEEEIAGVVGHPDALPPGWWIEGPYPAIRSGDRVEPWFPWPAFLWVVQDPGTGQRPVVRTRVMRATALEDLLPEGQVLLGVPGEAAGPAAGWLSASNLLWSLTGWGEWDPEGAVWQGKSHRSGGPFPPFVEPEPRPGLMVDPATGAAQDHMFYVARHHRFSPGSGLFGRLDSHHSAVPPPPRGSAFFGRRGRTVQIYEVTPSRAWESLRDGRYLSDRAGIDDAWHLRLVLLTPAIVGDDPPFPLPVGAGVRGVLARPGPAIGGFDLRAGGSRPARSTWAAGSTWWIALEGTAEERATALEVLQTWPPPDATEAQRFGFGRYLVARFDPKTGHPIAPEDSENV